MINLDSSVECLTQRRREAESAENARNLANTMNDESNLLEAKQHLKGETRNCLDHCDKTTNLKFSQHSLPLAAPCGPSGSLRSGNPTTSSRAHLASA